MRESGVCGALAGRPPRIQHAAAEKTSKLLDLQKRRDRSDEGGD